MCVFRHVAATVEGDVTHQGHKSIQCPHKYRQTYMCESFPQYRYIKDVGLLSCYLVVSLLVYEPPAGITAAANWFEVCFTVSSGERYLHIHCLCVCVLYFYLCEDQSLDLENGEVFAK